MNPLYAAPPSFLAGAGGASGAEYNYHDKLQKDVARYSEVGGGHHYDVDFGFEGAAQAITNGGQRAVSDEGYEMPTLPHTGTPNDASLSPNSRGAPGPGFTRIQSRRRTDAPSLCHVRVCWHLAQEQHRADHCLAVCTAARCRRLAMLLTTGVRRMPLSTTMQRSTCSHVDPAVHSSRCPTLATKCQLCR